MHKYKKIFGKHSPDRLPTKPPRARETAGQTRAGRHPARPPDISAPYLTVYLRKKSATLKTLAGSFHLTL